ncbi:MAG: hypothetical protein C0413_03165 [Clostridiales bacterium]|nr:hypothetical protein [Clostridiales bacterium]
MPARAEAAEPVVINDATGLLAMAEQPEGNYVLGADIDMRWTTWTPFAFSGSLDGAGHTIYNLTLSQTGEEQRITYDGRHRGYQTVFAALFSSVSGTVQNLNLLNVKADLSTDQPCFLAGIAGYLAKGTITHCSVSGRLKITSTAPQCGAGGIAGFGRGLIQDCAVDAEITIVAVNPASYCEEYLGGILANGFADVENCAIKLEGFTSVRGYVHNGGIVGLSDVNPENKRYFGFVRGCSVDARISFFEDVEDRRAYCSAYVGEIQNDDLIVGKNTAVRFESVESKAFARMLLPDTDENPVYNAVVTAPRCKELGYTTFTNPKTGYTYRDDYTAPAHTPGRWEVITPATYDSEGVRRQSCSECGVLLREEMTPKLIASASCSLNESSVRLPYQATMQLTATVLPEDTTDKNLRWMSSNETVLKVDGNGLVTAVGKGTAAIYVKTGDGLSSAACEWRSI